jgi:hypothetical protein
MFHLMTITDMRTQTSLHMALDIPKGNEVEGYCSYMENSLREQLAQVVPDVTPIFIGFATAFPVGDKGIAKVMALVSPTGVLPEGAGAVRVCAANDPDNDTILDFH